MTNKLAVMLVGLICGVGGSVVGGRVAAKEIDARAVMAAHERLLADLSEDQARRSQQESSDVVFDFVARSKVELMIKGDTPMADTLRTLALSDMRQRRTLSRMRSMLEGLRAISGQSAR